MLDQGVTPLVSEVNGVGRRSVLDVRLRHDLSVLGR